jgi:hypothetical protein
MSIREKTIKENAKQAELVEGCKTLAETMQIFINLNNSRGNIYLVVALPKGQFSVILFSGLLEIVKLLGLGSLSQPLANLPIPAAKRIAPTDATEAAELLDWLDSHPQNPVVVTQAGRFTALFVNPNRGLAGGVGSSVLHGEFVALLKDRRSYRKRKIPTPTCLKCHTVDFYTTNDHDPKQVVCANCNEIIALS